MTTCNGYFSSFLTSPFAALSLSIPFVSLSLLLALYLPLFPSIYIPVKRPLPTPPPNLHCNKTNTITIKVMSPAASSRWCPTPEQLMILEEMYRGGVRTPNASQIQQITAHLSFYGKIEGKNVFYWFQNHKARDRQKLRRKLSKQLQQQQQLHQHHHQPLQQENQYSQHLLHYLEPPVYSAVHQLFNYNTPPFLPQVGVVEDQASVMSYPWKMDIHGVDRSEMGSSMVRMYSHDWMMMMDIPPTPTTPCCDNSRPLKTLQLFPITATPNLKEDSSTTT